MLYAIVVGYRLGNAIELTSVYNQFRMFGYTYYSLLFWVTVKLIKVGKDSAANKKKQIATDVMKAVRGRSKHPDCKFNNEHFLPRTEFEL